MTINTIREVRRIHVGDEYTAKDPSGGGYYRAVAEETGYFILLADGCLFLSEDQLLLASRQRSEPPIDP